MAITFIGNSTLREDDVVIFGPLRFWAERGLIHYEDARDSAYGSMSISSALHRANALSDMLMNTSPRELNSEDQYDQANRLRHIRFLERMQALVNKCKIQGMPTDASARRDLVRRRPKSYLVPSVKGMM